jgi:hypothetical protein
VQLKISTFPWRLFCDMLSTKSNLVLRSCLRNDSVLCSAGCKILEDLNHLFLNCVFLDQFDKIYFGGWVCIGFSLMLFLLLINFVELIYFVKDIMMCIEAIWLVTVWTIKKERNMEMFEQKESSCKKLIYSIKVQVWWYLKAKKRIFIMIYNLWMVQLLV